MLPRTIKIKAIFQGIPLLILTLMAATAFTVSFNLPPASNQLVMSSIGDASFLNPVLSQDSASSDINGLVFNGLLKYDEDLNLVGDLADSWEVKEGPRPEITFNLRKNVRWHDGTPFTAEDVAFTYQAIMDPKTNTVRKSDYELVDRVEVLDPHKVMIRYREPFSPGLSSWTIGIIPRHLLQGRDINTHPFNRRPVGTGPFRFSQWVSDEKIVLDANPDYFEGPPLLSRIIYRIIPETSLSEIELLTGGVDLGGAYPHQVERLKKDARFRLFRYPSLGYTYIGYNHNNPLFQDKRVRQALTLAVNREELLKYVLNGLGRIATGPFPPHLWYANPGIHPWPYDPAKARIMLKDAGWEDRDGDGILEKDGKKFSFTLITNSGNDTRRDVGVLVQRYWKEVGIEARFEQYEWAVFLKNFVNPRHFEAVILGWGLGVDPDAYNIWHSSQIKDGFNFISYRNSTLDRLWEAGRRTYNLEKRKTIYREIHQTLHEEQPYTFLFVADAMPVLSKKFKAASGPPSEGPTAWREIEASKGGIMYHLERWGIPGLETRHGKLHP
jgi:peptide/nickel transport system substrate-binding protein